MDERRRFSASERAALYLAADGRCQRCGAPLEPGWHADHVQPWSLDGPTDVVNGQALCPDCNLRKGSRVDDLRAWQRRMHEKWLGTRPTDALICATPGAGKTYAALRLGQMLLNEGAIDRLVVVAPTDPLRLQWADAAGRVGLDLAPVKESADYDKAGYVGAASSPMPSSPGRARAPYCCGARCDSGPWWSSTRSTMQATTERGARTCGSRSNRRRIAWH
jgi:hypothetical protein